MSDKHRKLLTLEVCEASKILQLICCAILSDYAWKMGGTSGVICGIVMVIVLAIDAILIMMDILGFISGRISYEETSLDRAGNYMGVGTIEAMEELGKESKKNEMNKEEN